MVTSIGSSPLTVGGLDPGMMYSVTIQVFDVNQLMFRELKIIENITVMNNLGTLLYMNIYSCCIYICDWICENCPYWHNNRNPFYGSYCPGTPSTWV